MNYTSDLSANLGNELTPAQAATEPKVQWPVRAGAYYTLCMSGKMTVFHRYFEFGESFIKCLIDCCIDPDAPSRATPTLREILHWLVVNVPQNDLTQGEVLNINLFDFDE